MKVMEAITIPTRFVSSVPVRSTTTVRSGHKTLRKVNIKNLSVVEWEVIAGERSEFLLKRRLGIYD